MIDKNWARWIFASCNKHFYDRRDNIPMFTEGEDRETAELGAYFEYRHDGPYFKEPSKGYIQTDIEINILCVAKRNQDNHLIHRLTGIMSAAFTTEISVFKFGNTPEDDGSYVGCLIRRDENREQIVISNFGQIEADVPILQSCVEGHYRGHLTGA